MLSDGPAALYLLRYLAAILDAWSRRVLGYAISRSIDARVAVAALKSSYPSEAAAEGLHPPLGSRFAIGLRALSPPAGRTWSRRVHGRPRNPYDSAKAESFGGGWQKVKMNSCASTDSREGTLSLSGRFLSKVFNWLIRGAWFLFRVLLIAWATLAIYYSNLPSSRLRIASAISFAAIAIWLLWLSRDRRASVVFIILFLGVVAWWLSISPSHDRPWRPEVAVMPRATIDGDRVHIAGVRNFEYRSSTDFTVRYEERAVQLSHLTGLDFFVSYWSEGLVGHTFLSFIFDNAPPLSISIETRPEVGEGFNPVASLFKQFELIYVVGDERDLVRVRTNYRKETVYLYRLNSPLDDVRRLLMVYLKRINELADQPEFYHLLSNSCTINIIRYMNAAGRAGRFEFAICSTA